MKRKQYRLKGDHAVKCMAALLGDRDRSRPWYDVYYPNGNVQSAVFQVPAEFFEAAWELGDNANAPGQHQLTAERDRLERIAGMPTAEVTRLRLGFRLAKADSVVMINGIPVQWLPSTREPLGIEYWLVKRQAMNDQSTTPLPSSKSAEL